MPQSPALTSKEKQNGKRKLLIPSQDIQEIMEPLTLEEFTDLVAKTIPPSQSPDPETKRHRLVAIAPAVAERVFVQIRLQIFLAY